MGLTVNDTHSSRFIISSLPRTGSTALYRLLNCHQAVRCMFEPFHPKRYGGWFHSIAAARDSPDAALTSIWTHFNGVKHVIHPDGWPFIESPSMNDKLLSNREYKHIYIVRRNHLRRVISNMITSQTKLWVGSREDFRKTLDHCRLRRLEATRVLDEIARGRAAITHHLQLLESAGVAARVVYYEEVFDPLRSSQKNQETLGDLFEFLGFETISEAGRAKALMYFDPALYRFASAETYLAIPGVVKLESEVGSDENGWLFR
jgi:LPS sulfotransferase NodH